MAKNIHSGKAIVLQDSLALLIAEFEMRFQQLYNEFQSLKDEVDSTICSQADKIIELESLVHPESNDGEAICNFSEWSS